MKRLIIILIGFLSLSMTAGASSDSFQAVNVFWKSVTQYSAKGAPAERTEYINQFFLAHYDFEEFCRLTLADHWDAWSSVQKEDFLTRFQKLLLKSLTDHISKIYKGSLVAGASEINQDHAIQRFVVNKRNDSISFKVYLIKKGNEWKIDDLEIDDILLSRNYMSQFNRIIRNEGYAGLIAHFDSRITDMKTN